jgi:hypothetical protein
MLLQLRQLVVDVRKSLHYYAHKAKEMKRVDHEDLQSSPFFRHQGGGGGGGGGLCDCRSLVNASNTSRENQRAPLAFDEAILYLPAPKVPLLLFSYYRPTTRNWVLQTRT